MEADKHHRHNAMTVFRNRAASASEMTDMELSRPNPGGTSIISTMATPEVASPLGDAEYGIEDGDQCAVVGQRPKTDRSAGERPCEFPPRPRVFGFAEPSLTPAIIG